jgi:hypothetical protein
MTRDDFFECFMMHNDLDALHAYFALVDVYVRDLRNEYGIK